MSERGITEKWERAKIRPAQGAWGPPRALRWGVGGTSVRDFLGRCSLNWGSESGADERSSNHETAENVLARGFSAGAGQPGS